MYTDRQNTQNNAKQKKTIAAMGHKFAETDTNSQKRTQIRRKAMGHNKFAAGVNQILEILRSCETVTFSTRRDYFLTRERERERGMKFSILLIVFIISRTCAYSNKKKYHNRHCVQWTFENARNVITTVRHPTKNGGKEE